MMNIPDPNAVFPNEYKTSCFIKKRRHRAEYLGRRLHLLRRHGRPDGI